LEFEAAFPIELIIMISPDFARRARVYNDLVIAFKFSKLLGIDVLVLDGSDDPYQWLLVKSDSI